MKRKQRKLWTGEVFLAVLVGLLTAVWANGESTDLNFFPSFSDKHTVGLWLFDEPQYVNVTLTDASVHLYDLRLLPGGRLVPGRFGNALRLSSQDGPAARAAYTPREYDGSAWMIPDSRLVPPPEHLLATLAERDWTWEFWLKLDTPSKADSTIIEMGTGDRKIFSCGLTAGGKAFVLRSSFIGQNMTCPTEASKLADSRWHHIAFTWAKAEGKLRHYLDGQLQASPTTAKDEPEVQKGELQPGLIGSIFAGGRENNIPVVRKPLNVRATGQINFHWGWTRDLGWIERWRGRIKAPTSGEVDVWAEADALRLVIAGQTLIDGWRAPVSGFGKFRMVEGEVYPMLLEVFQGGEWDSRARLMWRWPGRDWELVPSGALWHTEVDEEKAKSEVSEVMDDHFYFTLGCGQFYDKPLDGMIDELRASDVVRYQEDFPMPGSVSRNYGQNPPKPAKPTGPPLLFAERPGSGTVKLGSRKHVFIDDAMVEARRSIHLVSNPPTPRPQDLKGVDSIPVSTYEHHGKEIQYIITENHVPRRQPGSPWGDVWGDGRVFEDPNLDVPPEERFKYAGKDVQRGIYLWVSPDGVHWRRNETILLPFDPDGGVETFWDDQRGMYVTFLRHMGWVHARPPFGRAGAMAQTREIFKPWPFEPQPNPEVILKAWTLPSFTVELPVPFEPYPETGHGGFVHRGHVYRTRALKYPWAPDTYLAFIWRLFYPPAGGDERRQTELATSRDGQSWKFYGEPYYYPNGWEMQEGIEVIEALAQDALVRRGDELWQYAFLSTTTHHGHRASEGRSRIVRYVQRLDGFASLDAREEAGWLRTRPFIFDGERLELNVAAKASVRVGILDEFGDAIPEFTITDGDPIQADSVRHVVTWNGNSDVRVLAGRVVRLWIEMQDAKLYAFQFVK